MNVFGENMTESMSRIIDTDMASEMTEYTQLTVLQQASTSMLSQANNRPQTIMSLLQGNVELRYSRCTGTTKIKFCYIMVFQIITDSVKAVGKII